MLEMVGDVDGKTCVIIDDMISTGGTLTLAAEMLKSRGAGDIYCAATHGVFAGDALAHIAASPIKRVVVTDSIPLPPPVRAMSPRSSLWRRFSPRRSCGSTKT